MRNHPGLKATPPKNRRGVKRELMVKFMAAVDDIRSGKVVVGKR